MVDSIVCSETFPLLRVKISISLESNWLPTTKQTLLCLAKSTIHNHFSQYNFSSSQTAGMCTRLKTKVTARIRSYAWTWKQWSHLSIRFSSAFQFKYQSQPQSPFGYHITFHFVCSGMIMIIAIRRKWNCEESIHFYKKDDTMAN